MLCACSGSLVEVTPVMWGCSAMAAGRLLSSGFLEFKMRWQIEFVHEHGGSLGIPF